MPKFIIVILLTLFSYKSNALPFLYIDNVDQSGGLIKSSTLNYSSGSSTTFIFLGAGDSYSYGTLSDWYDLNSVTLLILNPTYGSIKVVNPYGTVTTCVSTDPNTNYYTVTFSIGSVGAWHIQYSTSSC